MRNRKAVDAEMIERLRGEVEKFISHSLVAPSDFDKLSDTLRKNGHGYISPTTLKRVWGYIRDKGNDYSPSLYTLRALCNLLGFSDLDDFLRHDVSVQSKEYAGDYVEANNLPENLEITLMWSPDRLCRLRHISGPRFEVMVSRNTRLCVGDIVECGSFTQFAPIYMRVYRKDREPVTYVAGSSHGAVYSLSPTTSKD